MIRAGRPGSPCIKLSSRAALCATTTCVVGAKLWNAWPNSWRRPDRVHVICRRGRKRLMEKAERITPQSGDLIVMVGTVKGAFIFRRDRNRRQFQIAGPYFKGQAVFSAAYLSDKSRPRILMGNKSEHWGAMVSWSDDFG